MNDKSFFYSMPELPEVEMYKRYIDKYALHQKIKSAIVKNTKILQGSNKKQIESIITDDCITKTKRIGKYLFLYLSKNKFLVFHFGMTGKVHYFKNPQDEPRHSRFLIQFSNASYLSYDCQRLFGFIRLIDNIETYQSSINLAPDALSIPKEEFLTNIKTRTGKIKSILMNQHIISGIGNIYADEICFQNKIHPAQPINKLSNHQIEAVFNSISTVLTTAIDAHADFSKYPDTFIIPHRIKHGLCPVNKKHKLKTMKISGRTTYYCPIHQKIKGIK